MRFKFCAIMLVCFTTLVRGADDTELKSTVVSVGLFKNGLAVIKRQVKLPGPGTFTLSDVPEPVHGTWSVLCEAPVETRVGEREVATPLSAGDADFQNLLAGKQVTIFFRGGEGQLPPVTGKIEVLAKPKGDEAWNRNYHAPAPEYYGAFWNGNPASAAPPQNPARFLVLETDNGRVFVDSSMIGYIKSTGKELTATRRVPVLSLSVGKEAQNGATATITYLAKGMAWAPAYRVDISDPKQLTIEQTAVIRNELGAIENAEVQLISGFPSIEFGHVISPLSMHTNWSTFFQQLRQRITADDGATGNPMAQQAMYNNFAPRGGAGGGPDLSAEPAGEGIDVFYQSIGPRTLAEGESLGLSIAKASADYERIIEWTIADTRNAYGQPADLYGRQPAKDDEDGNPWDAVRFKNPFKFPMTTGPAAVVANDRFEGQRMSYWVNAGERACVKVTRSLSLRTRSTEHEVAGTREDQFVGGRNYRRTIVDGELKLNNHRKEDVTVVIRRQFSGEMLSADANPDKTLREEGVYSVNQRNELTWTLTLKSGEEKTLKYKYAVLVMN